MTEQWTGRESAGPVDGLRDELGSQINGLGDVRPLNHPERWEMTAYRCAVDAVTSAVFGVDRTSRVVLTNRAGKNELKQGRWLRAGDGTLVPGSEINNHAHVSNALRQLSLGTPFKIVMSEGTHGAQAVVWGAAIPEAVPLPISMSAVALVWLTTIKPNEDIAGDLATLFPLTAAEQRLAARLIAGSDLRDAARDLRVSVHTARTQLKTIFGKTGLRSQAALLSFAARLAGLRG